jgi:steroid 5-alpha reductase family enzyme
VLLFHGSFSLRRGIVVIMAVMWGVRLATYFFIRINKIKRYEKKCDGNNRYKEYKEKTSLLIPLPRRK